MPETLPEARFSNPESGLYGEIATPGGERLWRSPSLVGRGLHPIALPEPGRTQFERTTTSDAEPVFAIAMLVDFQLNDARTTPLVFTVAESLAPFSEEVGHFRSQLFGWFAGLTVVLLAAQAWLMRVVLRPLRRVEREIVEIEEGARSELGCGYPAELHGVTENLNALIAGERARLERYRNTLGNLAHSLKTPLAVMQSSLERGDPDAETLHPQVERMSDIVGYQLQRAAGVGRRRDARPRADRGRARGPLDRGCVAEGSTFTSRWWPRSRWRRARASSAEEGDLMELAGNLLDNAFKWCRGRVVLRAAPLTSAGQRRAGLWLTVEDDGPGIDEAQRERVLERGVRADERTPGHGIGLAVVHDIVRLHGGELSITRSELAGRASSCACRTGSDSTRGDGLRPRGASSGGDDASILLPRSVSYAVAAMTDHAISIPDELPIAAARAAIEDAVRAHPVVVVCGETGSGKSTQLPKIALGLGCSGMIGHTQPRRIAARSLAARIAEEIGDSAHTLVGYQVRFADRTGPTTRIKLMTDGILLAELAAIRCCGATAR